MSLQDGTTLFETAKPKTVEMAISTNNRYLATWETFYTTPGNTQGNNNFEIVDMKSKTVVKSMIHKKQTGW